MKKPMYIKNSQDDVLFKILKERVKERISSIKENRNKYIWLKVILMPLLYFGFYALALIYHKIHFVYLSCFFLMGLQMVTLYLNLLHEAAHHNIFKKKSYNLMVLKLFELIGANSYIWAKRHLVSHHAYPNVNGWDTDIEQSGPIKIYPYGPTKGFQKHQHLLCFIIYPLYLFNWLLIRDFKDFFFRKRIIRKFYGRIPSIEKIKLVLFKLLYFSYQIGIPIFILNVAWNLALVAWFIQLFTASIFALLVLLPPHAMLENSFPSINKQYKIEKSWFRHQFEATSDLSNHNNFIRYFLGNFNYHVAHHLFPNYSYEYYDEITEEVKKFANEFQLAYKVTPMFKALKNHYILLKTNANNLSQIMEETM